MPTASYKATATQFNAFSTQKRSENTLVKFQ